MAQNQIDGGKQIRSGTITTTQLASGAAITDGQLATSYIKADGTRAFTGDQSMGSHKITSLTDGTADTDAATYGQVKALFNGQDIKASVRLATTGSETFTISGGAVTQIAGTTVDGVTGAVGNRILIKNAPASTGTGTADDTNATGTSQPANGIYTVTNATTNLTVTRDTDADSSAEVTAGMTTTVAEGTAFADAQWTLVTNDAITLNTTALQFTRTDRSVLAFTGGLTKTGITVKRDDLTGDVTTTSNGNATTIANSAVTLAKMANLAANSVIANNTGSSAAPAALGLTAAATASTAVLRDANVNTKANAFIDASATTATAAGTTTLTVSSAPFQQFTGATTQTVVMPDATTLVLGQHYVVSNRSSGAITVNANGGGNLGTVSAGNMGVVTLIAAGSAAGTWDFQLLIASASGTGDASTNTSSSVDSEVALFSGTGGKTLKRATGTGLAKLTSGVLSTATASTDYMAPSGFVDRETPSGSVNGSNTTFTLANTPIAGSEHVYLNGLLQEPGAGNDYTISGATITYLTAPSGTGPDKIRVSYRK